MRFITILLLSLLFVNCHKDNKQETVLTCDMQKVYDDNAQKVTIPGGIWGTVALMEGNCMPVVPPTASTCKICPVQRTLRIYDYTKPEQASPSNTRTFYDSFTTQLIKEVTTDENGFFQTELPAGHYTIVAVEKGKLYAFGPDGQGGISPFTFTGGKQNINLTLIYAVF